MQTGRRPVASYLQRQARKISPALAGPWPGALAYSAERPTEATTTIEHGEWQQASEIEKKCKASDPELWDRSQKRAQKRTHPIWGEMYRLPKLTDMSEHGEEHREDHVAETIRPAA